MLSCHSVRGRRAHGGVFVCLDRPFATFNRAPTTEPPAANAHSPQRSSTCSLQAQPLLVEPSSHSTVPVGANTSTPPPRLSVAFRLLKPVVSDNPAPLPTNPTRALPVQILCLFLLRPCPPQTLHACCTSLSTRPSTSPPQPQFMLPNVSRPTSYHHIFTKAIRSVKWR
jgi:hypothetical protein